MANRSRVHNPIDQIVELSRHATLAHPSGGTVGGSSQNGAGGVASGGVGFAPNAGLPASGGAGGGNGTAAVGNVMPIPPTTQPIGDGSVTNPIRTQHGFLLGVDSLGGINAYLVVLNSGVTYSF